MYVSYSGNDKQTPVGCKQYATLM